jgi:hypothetical protein
VKAIISHDIDHITVWEHLSKDTILPKFVVRANIELFSGKISGSEYFIRLGDFIRNKWQCIDELLAFNSANEIPSSFFLGVQNGMGLSYSLAASKYWAHRISEAGANVHVHGIEFETLDLICRERELFCEITGKEKFGVRMHYVRKNDQTFMNMNKAGYLFDSTEHAFVNPYKIGDMWEFPFQIMDGWVIENGKKWQDRSLESAKDETKRLIDQAAQKDLKYLGVDFHDRYYSKSFATWMNWYEWIVSYLKQNGIEFIDFEGAIHELENGASAIEQHINQDSKIESIP